MSNSPTECFIRRVLSISTESVLRHGFTTQFLPPLAHDGKLGQQRLCLRRRFYLTHWVKTFGADQISRFDLNRLNFHIHPLTGLLRVGR